MVKVSGFRVNRIIKWPIGRFQKGIQSIQKLLGNHENGMDKVKKAQRSSLGTIDQEIKQIQKLLVNGKVEIARELLEVKVLPELAKVDESLLPMLHLPGRYYNIMMSEVTVGQFKQFVEHSGYKITGHNSNRLKRILAECRHPQKEAVYCVNLYDSEAYAKWLSEQIGREFRVPTEEEWEYAMTFAMTIDRKIMSGEGFEWTRTKWGRNRYALHSFYYDRKVEKARRYDPNCISLPVDFLPSERYIDASMRLIEAIKIEAIKKSFPKRLLGFPKRLLGLM